MTECFVSYKREDEARVRLVVQGLREAGLNVWWDRDIPGGGRWRETIVEHLDAARCVVVCWTQASTGPDGAYVREEAERAKARGALLPVLLDPVSPPFGFGEVQALNLQGWQGGGKDAQWVHFVATVRAFVSGQPPPKPPKPAIWRWSAISAGAGAFALMVGFINDVQGLQGSLCRADSVRGMCRSLGLGGVPSLEEEEAWTAAQQRQDGDGYRDYLRVYSQGAYAQAALARHAACRPIAETHWQARDDDLPLFVKPDLAPTPTESAARERTLPELRTAASKACGFFDKTDTHRLRGTRVDEAGWRCEPSPAGWRCHYDGKVVCELEVRSTTQREVCGDPGQAASAQASGNPR